jgi:hypothetical protein
MAFQVSPGVQVREIDLTNVVPAVSSTTGAIAGKFRWGPVNEVRTVSDSKGLVENFYSPSSNEAETEDFYSAEAFLRYGQALRVVRIKTNGLFSANASGDTSSLLENFEDYQSDYQEGSLNGTVGDWIAKYAGALGNSLKVSVCASSSAYYNAAVTTTSAEEAVGQTVISVTDADVFTLRDIVTFGSTDTVNKYRITAKDNTPGSETITVEALGQPANTGLVVSVSSGSNINRYWEFYNLFDKAPSKSASATAAGGSNDELHVVVVDEDGVISGTVNTVLETYGFLSMASDAKDSVGNSNYYKNVINGSSEYIYWSGHNSSTHTSATSDVTHATSATSAFSTPSAPINSSLSGGADGRSPTAGEKYGAWDEHFSDAETVDISFLICGSTRTDNGSGTDQDLLVDWTSIVNQGIALCDSRKDCLFVASPRKIDVVFDGANSGSASKEANSESNKSENVIATVNTATSSSYTVFDSGWVYQYDRYNDKYCWVPGNGHTAGIMARSDLLQDPWYSPAGFNRGQYLGITKLAFQPKQASRDDLYRARINPIVTFPGQGTILYGDKTGLTVPSAFDRINVRRLFIVLEKAIATAAKAQLFEFNDAFTRAQFRAAVEPFLRDVKNRRGLVDFSVLCDETNNTDTVIDRNEFVCSIFVKPARSINFITLNFVAARSGVEFEEIYGAV